MLQQMGKIGDYKFSVKAVDDAGGTKKLAQTVKANKTYKYKINSTGDVDLYVYNSWGKKIATINAYKGMTVKNS